MKNPNPRLLYLLPLLLTVALIVFGEALSDLWKEDVKALFWHNKWGLLFIVLLIALVIYLWERQQRSEKPVPEAVDKDQYEEAFVLFRKNLLEQYQTRLASKTGRRLPINLTAKSTHFGMAPERVEAYFKDKERTIESEDIASEIDKILKKFDRLLLIGDPGAGKTTILLYAAINILCASYSSDDLESSDEMRALRSDDSKSSDRSAPKSLDRSKLPLLLNLATWSEGRDFAEWYAQNIAHTYNLSPVFVRELLRRNAVVPFFDGFDEVAEKYRDDCFRQMAAYFHDERKRQLIVSSRKKEYAAAEADAPVYAEIEVQPLSLAQIKKALTENAHSQAADRALLHALEHDRWLAEAVETPFYLNTASFLFGKSQKMLKDFPFEADSAEGRQAELVEIFVAEQVPEERDKKYLHFLAGKMEQENFLVFELVKMQPRWCKGMWRWRIAVSLVVGIVISIVVGLPADVVISWNVIEILKEHNVTFTVFDQLLVGLRIALNLSILLGLIGIIPGIIISWVSSKISTTDIQFLRRNAFFKNWRKVLKWGFIGGVLSSASFGLIFLSLILGLLVTGDAIDSQYYSENAHKAFVYGCLFGLGAGLVGGIIFGLKKAGTSINPFLHILNPYQRFWATFKLAFWELIGVPLALVTGFFILSAYRYGDAVEGFVILFTEEANLWLFFLPLLLLFIFIPLLMSQLLQHFSLRLALYFEGKMPLRVVTFMDRMTDQLIFEDNRRTNKKGKKMRGATWRFRHKILQDYFAGHPA